MHLAEGEGDGTTPRRGAIQRSRRSSLLATARIDPTRLRSYTPPSATPGQFGFQVLSRRGLPGSLALAPWLRSIRMRGQRDAQLSQERGNSVVNVALQDRSQLLGLADGGE